MPASVPAASGPLQALTVGRQPRSPGCLRLSGLGLPLCAVRTFDNVTTIACCARENRVLIQRCLASQLRARPTPARPAPRWCSPTLPTCGHTLRMQLRVSADGAVTAALGATSIL